MAVRIKSVSKTDLCNVVVPVFTDGYKIKSHSSIITAVEAGIIKAGYKIKNTVYKATADGKLAYGTYYLEDEEDEEIGRMLTWVNAYTKQFKYRTISGIYIKDIKGCVAFAGDAYLKKYTGLGDEIADLNLLFAETVEKKNLMMGINLNRTEQATILGRLFAEYGVFTTEQASFFKTMITDTETLWDTYANVADTLQSSHPKDWIRNQILLNYLFNNLLELHTTEEEIEEATEHTLENNYGQPDNQTNILNQIADLEADQIDEDVRYEAAETEETEDIVIHVESDQEYLERVAKIEGEPELEMVDPKTNEQLVAEHNATHDDSQIKIEYISPEKLKEKYGENVAVNNLMENISEDLRNMPTGELLNIVKPKVEEDTSTQSFIEAQMTYTDPVGNTFEAPLMSAEVIVFDLSKPDEPVTDLQEFNRLMDTVDTVTEEVEEDLPIHELIDQINTVPSLEPTNEEYLLIEKELDQEIINVESLFETAKPPVVTGILDDWDLSVDRSSSDEDEFFL